MQTCHEGITPMEKSMQPKCQKKAKEFSQVAHELKAAIQFCSWNDPKQHSIQCLASQMSCRRYFFLLLASPNAYANKNKYMLQFVVKKASIICKKKKKCATYLHTYLPRISTKHICPQTVPIPARHQALEKLNESKWDKRCITARNSPFEEHVPKRSIASCKRGRYSHDQN